MGQSAGGMVRYNNTKKMQIFVQAYDLYLILKEDVKLSHTQSAEKEK